MKTFTIYTDGAARGNPGPAGAGWVVLKREAVVSEGKKYLGEMTNNQAEYKALLLALKDIQNLEKPAQMELNIFCDSELLVKQVNGEYKIKNEGLKPLFQEALLTLSRLGGYSIHYVPREKNKEADRLANEAIDEFFQ